MSTKTESIPVVLVPRELSNQALLLFEQSLKEMINRSPDRLDLDCSDLGLVSSSHVNVLWAAREKCEAADIHMRLCKVSTGLIRILKVLDLDEFFLRDEAATAEENEPRAKHAQKQDDHRLDISVKSSSDEILDALHRFREFLKMLNVDPLCAIELETVFYETLTNIRVHGEIEKGDTIEFSATANSVAMEMTFTDRGRPFNPTEHVRNFDPGAAIRTRQKHGFGLTMIARMSDSMDYRRENDELNVLKLKKYWE